jgi:response regulator of citrate/malate metabolism
MTQRLQVLLEEDEFAEIRAHAAMARMSVAEWVRQVLRSARHEAAVAEPARKLAVVREAASRYSFPTADIDVMNAEIARGYLGRPDETL